MTINSDIEINWRRRSVGPENISHVPLNIIIIWKSWM